jgi:hypothetical protein
MTDELRTVRARVLHQTDRSYVVLIHGPGGEEEVGRTSKTREVLAMAQAGAARMWGVPEDELAPSDVVLEFPQPPYGRDGQWVRIIAVDNPADPYETAEVGLLARAHWFGHEGAWFVTVTGAGTSVHPSEHLDFAPTVTDREVAAFHAYLSNTDPTA